MKKYYALAILFIVSIACTKEQLLQELVTAEKSNQSSLNEETTQENDTILENGTSELIETPSENDLPGADYPEDGVKVSLFGFDSKDASSAIIAAIKSDNKTIIIDKQSEDWVVEPLVFSNIKDKRIYIEDGVIIKAKENAFNKVTDALIEFRESDNITVDGHGATLLMNKEEYTDGQWRHGISIKQSSNITIRGLEVRDSGGDGIYIGGTSEEGSYSSDIIVDYVTAINNKRQGMSIVSAEGVWVSNSVFTETKGTLPEAGLDIEPNHEYDRLVNINFSDCKFTNNNYAGIVLSLGQMTSNSLPISVYFNNCYTSYNASEENEYSNSEIVLTADKKDPVGGEVVFDNLEIDGSNYSMLHSRKRSDAFYATFKNCVIKNVSQKGENSPIYLQVGDYYELINSLGGFTFDNVYIEYDKDLPYMQVRGSSTLQSFKDVSGNFSVKNPYQNDLQYVNYDWLLNLNVNIQTNWIMD